MKIKISQRVISIILVITLFIEMILTLIFGIGTYIQFTFFVKDSIFDYPQSIWYSEDTGYYLSLQMWDLKKEMSLIVFDEEQNEKHYNVCHWGSRYYINDKKVDGIKTGAAFSIEIEKKQQTQIAILSDFSYTFASGDKDGIYTEEIFKNFESITFEKILSQNISESPNIMWYKKV